MIRNVLYAVGVLGLIGPALGDQPRPYYPQPQPRGYGQPQFQQQPNGAQVAGRILLGIGVALGGQPRQPQSPYHNPYQQGIEIGRLQQQIADQNAQIERLRRPQYQGPSQFFGGPEELRSADGSVSFKGARSGGGNAPDPMILRGVNNPPSRFDPGKITTPINKALNIPTRGPVVRKPNWLP